ncbi:MAG: hypothetical protein V1872_06760 [bacterium]
MKKISATDTLDLSISERIQLVEDNWYTIALKAESIELTRHLSKIILQGVGRQKSLLRSLK